MPDARPREGAAEPSPEAAFRAYLDASAGRMERRLNAILPAARNRPRLIHESMRYTALSGGKRLRPALVLLAYETAGGTSREVPEHIGAALEMVHAFSLIHDDLPCMDDDDYRRGKPSNHVVYGEGVAVLAGDALLTEAFGVLAALAGRRTVGPDRAVRLVGELAGATGSRGVIGGQVLDLTSEGKAVGAPVVRFIHRHKTARLFVAALRLGALGAGAGPRLLDRLSEYGEAAGLAYQVVDDLLGAAGTFRELGRDPGRDRERGKATYPSVLGLPASHRAATRLLRRARAAAGGLPRRRDLYLGFCDLVDRRRRDPQGRLLGGKGTS